MVREHFPGLVVDKTPSGKDRYRVRVAGNPKKRITLSVAPDHYDFSRQYHDARAGYHTSDDSFARLTETGPIERDLRKLLEGAKSRAKKKGWDFALNINDLRRLLDEQKCECALSGIAFDLRPNPHSARRAFTVSIDRINNRLGYVPDNIRLVTTIVNIARSDWPDADFQKMCRSVVKMVERVPRDGSQRGTHAD